MYMCGMDCVCMQSLGVSGVYMCWLICVVWGDGVCVLGEGSGMRPRCSIKKTFTASRLIILQMKYICTHTTNINLGQSKVVKKQTAAREEKVPSGGEVWDGFLEEPTPGGRVRLGAGREHAGREDEVGIT